MNTSSSNLASGTPATIRPLQLLHKAMLDPPASRELAAAPPAPFTSESGLKHEAAVLDAACVWMLVSGKPP
jgi:hypothetical protein